MNPAITVFKEPELIEKNSPWSGVNVVFIVF